MTARGRAAPARPARGRAGPARPGRGRADPARRVAFDVLHAVAERDAYANLLLSALLAERGLTGRDAALATELTYGALRGQGSYDAILAICSDRDLGRLDPPLRPVLRLGAHQLLATRIGAHAAVATSVDLAKDVAGPRPAGFVNAVLRRVATRDLGSWLEIAAPSRADDLAGHLSVTCSHPRWIVGALSEALGEDPGPGGRHSAGRDRGRSGREQRAPAGHPLRRARAGRPGRAGGRRRAAGPVVPVRRLPGRGRSGPGDGGGRGPGVGPGRGQPAGRARAGPGGRGRGGRGRADVAGRTWPGAGRARRRRWLDLCAGPGGKARLLAGLAGGRGARLLAADVRPHRARLLRAQLPPAAPGGAASAAVVAADGTAAAWPPGTFDRVLADVPCSGLGALRRRPEARWRRSPEDVAALGPLQRALLAAALDSAAPGGVVAYVTCSPHLAETRDVVTGVLAGRDDVEVLDAPAVLPEVPGLRCPEPYGAFAQFWPHRHGTDAIFLALLRRSA